MFIDLPSKKFNQKIQPRTMMARKETEEPPMKIFGMKRSKTPEKEWWDHRNSSDDEIKRKKLMKKSDYQSAIEVSSDSDDLEMSARVMESWDKNRRSKFETNYDFSEEKEEKVKIKRKRGRPTHKFNKEKYEKMLETRNSKDKSLPKKPDEWENDRAAASRRAKFGAWRRYKIEPTTPDVLKRQMEAGKLFQKEWWYAPSHIFLDYPVENEEFFKEKIPFMLKKLHLRNLSDKFERLW
jgi:hypothetical protein